MPTLCIYIGDSRDVTRRLAADHSGGNAEGSALRRHVAEEWAINSLVRNGRAAAHVYGSRRRRSEVASFA